MTPKEISTMTHNVLAVSLITRLRSSAKAFRENTVYGQDGDPIRLGVQAGECDEAADLLESLLADLTAANARVKDAEGVIEPFALIGSKIREAARDERWLETILFYAGDDNDPSKWSLSGRAFDAAAQWLAHREGRS